MGSRILPVLEGAVGSSSNPRARLSGRLGCCGATIRDECVAGNAYKVRHPDLCEARADGQKAVFRRHPTN